MKRYFICLIFAIAFFMQVSFAENVEIRVNYGKFNLPTEPVIENDRTLIPLKAVAEVFGAKVEWDPRRFVTVNYKENEIVLPIDSNRVIVNNDVIKLDTKTIIKDSYTMVPLKFLSEYLNINIEWYENERIVNLVIEDEEIVARAENVSRSYAKRTQYPKAIGKIVVIDPGHGGSQTGAYYSGIAEKKINLAIAEKVKDKLKEQGVKVYMTRESDVTTSLEYRSKLSNSVNADLFVSIHSNAMTNSAIKGTEVLYKNTSKSKNGISNIILAQYLQNSVSEIAGTYNKGIINRNDLYVLNHTYSPAALVEVAYMTNYSDMSKLKTISFQEKAAEGIATGILKSIQTGN